MRFNAGTESASFGTSYEAAKYRLETYGYEEMHFCGV